MNDGKLLECFSLSRISIRCAGIFYDNQIFIKIVTLTCQNVLFTILSFSLTFIFNTISFYKYPASISTGYPVDILNPPDVQCT